MFMNILHSLQLNYYLCESLIKHEYSLYFK
nr:MAG TPA: hypothetical protein [Caudoviricetes sp.]